MSVTNEEYASFYDLLLNDWEHFFVRDRRGVRFVLRFVVERLGRLLSVTDEEYASFYDSLLNDWEDFFCL